MMFMFGHDGRLNLRSVHCMGHCGKKSVIGSKSDFRVKNVTNIAGHRIQRLRYAEPEHRTGGRRIGLELNVSYRIASNALQSQMLNARSMNPRVRESLAAMSAFQLDFLGGFSLQVDGKLGPPFPTDKTRALLAYLALASSRPQSRAVLATLLWPEADEQSARANLRVTLHRLHQILDRADPVVGRQLLVATRQSVHFNRAHATVDVLEFKACLKAVNEHPHQALVNCDVCLPTLRQAVDLYDGELLAGLGIGDAPPFEEWLSLRREYWHQEAVAACDMLADAQEARGQYREARATTLKLLALDTYREESHRRLMRLLARDGMRDAALDHYDTLRQLLHTELGVEPTDATNELMRQISVGAFDVASPPVAIQASAVVAPRSDWSQAPVVGSFFGRAEEARRLEAWLVHERSPLVGLLGMGGVGKSTLATHMMRDLAGQFDVVLWYSLLNGPPLSELLTQVLVDLTALPRTELPQTLDGQLAALLGFLRQWRCLLVLDNVETVIQFAQGERAQAGYAEYVQLYEMVGTRSHQSALLFTSRMRPPGFARMETDLASVHSLVLAGLDDVAVGDILRAYRLNGSADEFAALTARYSGNPLALKLVAQAIADFYGGAIDEFLADETLIFDDIRDVLRQQLEHLSPLEHDIMNWLAVARRPLRLPELRASLLEPVRAHEVLQALRALQRRSLLEKTGNGSTLQNVIIEFLTECLVDDVVTEISRGEAKTINRFALLEAQAHDYVRQIQMRMLLAPIADRLARVFDTGQVDALVRDLLTQLRGKGTRRPGYAAGNLLDLLLYMGIPPAGYDFSHLSVWQASLSGHAVGAINFTGADLAQTVFDNSFGLVWTVAGSPDGRLVAAGTADGKLTLWHAGTAQLLMSWTAHASTVYTLDFAPDGSTLASGGADGMIYLWEILPEWLESMSDAPDLPAIVAGSPPLRIALSGHTAAVQQVAFQPEAAFSTSTWSLASASDDMTIRLWDTTTGTTVRTLHGHHDFVTSLALSPDGQWLASGSRGKTDEDRVVNLWNLPEGRLLHAFRHGAWVNAVAFSTDGRWLASGDETGALRLWRLRRRGSTLDPSPTIMLDGHEGAIHSLAFSPDSRMLVSAGSDRAVRLWDLATLQTRHILVGHTGWVTAIAFDPNNRILISGGWDCTVRQWDSHSGQALRTFHGGTGGVFCVAFSPDGHDLATTGSDGVTRVWDVATGRVRHTMPTVADIGWRTAFSPDGMLLADSFFNGAVRLLPVDVPGAGAPGAIQPSLLPTETATGASGVAFSPDGRYLAASFFNGAVLLEELAQPIAPRTMRSVRLDGHVGWCLAVAFSPDGAYLASAGADHRIVLWDMTSQCMVRVLEGHANGVQEIAFSPDGALLASASWDHTVCLWNVATGDLVYRLEGHSDIAQSVTFSPDGVHLASCAYDGTVRFWNVASGRCARIVEAHKNWVHFVAFSPDGRMLASGSADGSVKLWDPETGDCLAVWHIPGPYAGMDITGALGLTTAQRTSLHALGAVDGIHA